MSGDKMNKKEFRMASQLDEMGIPWTSFEYAGSAVMRMTYSKEERGDEWKLMIYLGKREEAHSPHQLAWSISGKMAANGFVLMETIIQRHENWQDIPADNEFTIHMTFIAPKDQE